MGSYIVRRLFQVPLLLLLVSLIIFALMHVAPGDPVPLILGDYRTAESETALRHELGLDRPLPVQYTTWVGNALRGDLGKSVYNKQSVSTQIFYRIPNTLYLALLALIFALMVGIPTGILAAVRQNSWVDYLSMSVALSGVSVPNFVLAIYLILLIGVYLDLLPISGGPPVMQDPVGATRYLILPALALGAPTAGTVARLLRSSMVEILSKDYILVARGKGLTDSRVHWHHALKNALIPTVTVLGINFAYMLGGSVVIEQVFSLPGIGNYMMEAVFARDYPVIQGISLVVSVIFVATNLITDLSYSFLDPRIRYD